MVKIVSKNIVGSAGNASWSQAQTIEIGANAYFLVVIKLLGSEEDSLVDLPVIGAKMLEEIEGIGRTNQGKDLLQAAIEKVCGGVESGLKIELLVAKFQNLGLWMYGRGSVEAYLMRGGKVAKLKDAWGDGEILEGRLEIDDLLVVSTSKLVEAVGVNKFVKIVAEDSEPAELLTPIIHAQADSSGIAGIVAQVQDENNVDTKESFWDTLKQNRPMIKLRNEMPRKFNLWLGAIIFALLILMIGVGMVRREKIQAQSEFDAVKISVEAKVNESLASGNLNPEKSKNLLVQAKNEVQAYLSKDLKPAYKTSGDQLLTLIEDTELKVFKKNEVELRTIVELSILEDGLKADKMKSDGHGNIIFIDQEKQKIVSMNLVDQSKRVIDSDKVNNYIDLGISDTKIYSLREKTVDELFWKRDLVTTKIEADEFWKTPSEIELFAGNIYILDLEQSEIWKYPIIEDGFGERRRWLAAGITPNLANVVDMKVVGDIWLLTSTGKLERYSRGAPVNFSMDGFPASSEAKKFSNPSALWVDDNAAYVLESGVARVVSFGIEGNYEAQYVNSEFAKASDLVVVDGKGYVLIENTVKEFSL